jgi:hypothetical protein
MMERNVGPLMAASEAEGGNAWGPPSPMDASLLGEVALAEHWAESGTSSSAWQVEAGVRGGVEPGGVGARSRSGTETSADARSRLRRSSERYQGAWGAKREAPAAGEARGPVGCGGQGAGGAGGGVVALPGGESIFTLRESLPVLSYVRQFRRFSVEFQFAVNGCFAEAGHSLAPHD